MKQWKKRAVQGSAAATALTGITLAAMAAQGAYRVYYANDEAQRNVVMILSDAPLETMLTRTGNVTAEVKVDPANALNDPKARFVVDLASLETGIKARDDIMRSPKWSGCSEKSQSDFYAAQTHWHHARCASADAQQNAEIQSRRRYGIAWHDQARDGRCGSNCTFC